jgi:hypothetical protein
MIYAHCINDIKNCEGPFLLLDVFLFFPLSHCDYEHEIYGMVLAFFIVSCKFMAYCIRAFVTCVLISKVQLGRSNAGSYLIENIIIKVSGLVHDCKKNMSKHHKKEINYENY